MSQVEWSVAPYVNYHMVLPYYCIISPLSVHNFYNARKYKRKKINIILSGSIKEHDMIERVYEPKNIPGSPRGIIHTHSTQPIVTLQWFMVFDILDKTNLLEDLKGT